jgi:hypothetical protein
MPPLLSDDVFRLAVLRPLEDATLRATGGGYERIIFLDGAGQLLFMKDGHPDGVEFSAEEIATYRGRVDLATHNHPGGASLSTDDVLIAIALDVREVNAFAPGVRYRLHRRAAGAGWPSLREAQTVIRELDRVLHSPLRRLIERGAMSPLDAYTMHRHLRWQRFAARFAGDVDYVVERR